MAKRFKLIFLAEQEQYITDIGCTITVRFSGSESALPSGATSSVKKLLSSGELRGRLRICSFSVYLDIDSLVWYILYIMHFISSI